MNDTTANQNSTMDIVQVTEYSNSGIRPIALSRVAIGYVQAGTKYLYNNDRFYQVNKGDIFFLNPGFHYEERITDDSGRFSETIFYLTPSTLQQATCGLGLNFGLKFTSRHSCDRCIALNFSISKGDGSIQNFFASVEQSLRISFLRENEIFMQIKLNELIYLLLTGEDNCTKRKLLRAVDTTSGQFVNIVYENIFNDISIEQLAELTNRSLTSFKKEFKRIFNSSPHHWIIEQRLDRAKILLSVTSYTVSEIGVECGFSNISHFIKLFKQRHHHTPVAYRRLFSAIADTPQHAVGE